ncbi:M23 family metallopeptidase [Candidatus Collierbacteria bacterium]|nr:M23 family metallopeptidase [Candidatus Collierbacteria bacterium]
MAALLGAPGLIGGLGSTIAATGIAGITLGAIITVFFVQPTTNAGLFVPTENAPFGGISLQGCPAEAWPVDISRGQKYYIAQGPGGWATHGPSLPSQPANCPTANDPNAKCPYVEALDITPPGTVTSNNVVIATHPGTVIEARVDGYGANYVHIKDSCGGNFRTVYVHMSVLSVAEGQSVKGGDVIGVVGSTGRSSGPHLHYEFRDVGGNYKSRQDPPPHMIKPYIPITVPIGCVGNCNINIP